MNRDVLKTDIIVIGVNGLNVVKNVEAGVSKEKEVILLLNLEVLI